MQKQIYKKAIEGFSILFLMKVFSRVIDFLLNILVIRELDPQIYGLTIHYMIITNVVLFYSKNCLKNSYQKRGIKNINNILFASAQNLMIFGLYFTIIIGFITLCFWNYYYTQYDSNFIYGAIFCVLGCIFDCMCEPLLSKYILNFEYSISAKSEAFSFFGKTLILFFLTKFNFFHTLINFGISQMVQGFIMLFFCIYFTGENMHLFPKKLEGQNYYIIPEMKEMGYQFTLLSFFRMISQELEKFVLILLNKQTQTQINSEYLIVSNIGSIVPRYIYAPTEDICFNLFSKLSNKHIEEDNNEKDYSKLNLNNNSATTINRKINVDNVNQQSFQQQYFILQTIIKLINVLGLFFVFFGVPYASAFLQLMYGNKWNYVSCIQALQYFCVKFKYILIFFLLLYFIFLKKQIYEWFMGINGLLEAFVQGSIQQKELQMYKFLVLISTCFYIICSFNLIQFGSKGIIISSIISMSVRICISSYYVLNKIFLNNKKQFRLFLISTLPDFKLIFGFFFSIFLSNFFVFRQFQNQAFKQIVLGAG
ncbi:nuclear division rft1-like protein, putative [Ichthyophthirius multifiliis]|uniref:Protein RFT1 homolog n=1 Tax=Ichthyophthirius multifiliis TaxID=5932 RepID=G0R5X5_ICHMU|nr:nuclear division rft1-like protein, putative [Ichthyophthirius multifiliis]EGR27152.1 nuclear division rft1-like protein, putative [Ichthyophthirius multifiliis]|eukprot:XP_004024036.1 nuclear division rft1-like protein, putative [Ichthyophthirius multifiliis]